MHRRQFGSIVGAALTLVIVPTFVAVTTAQDRPVTVEGKVTWIAGDKMVVAPPASLSVTVDLSRVDLSEYRGLLSGDWVIVNGTVPLGENRVIATFIQRVER